MSGRILFQAVLENDRLAISSLIGSRYALY